MAWRDGLPATDPGDFTVDCDADCLYSGARVRASRLEATAHIVRAALITGGVVAAAVTAAARPAAAAQLARQAPARVGRSVNLEIWLSAVRSHAPGRADAAVDRIAPWNRHDLEAVLQEAHEQLFVDAPLLKRAAVLHADIAAAHRNENGYSLPSDGRTVDFIHDGNRVGTRRSGTVHWDFGRRILRLVKPDDDVRLWYRATCAFLQSWGEYSELVPHLKQARALLPDDAVLLLYEGTLHAAYAEPRIQQLFANVESTRMRTVGSSSQELGEARRAFEMALEIEPDLMEARIRLAYVWGLRGRHETAAAELRRAVDQPLAGPLQYDAWLLLGREEEALGRREAARSAFVRAAALYPRAQSPRLGLSQLARAEGDRASARRALELLSQDADEVEDPWWSFSQRHAPDQLELFVEMRRRLAP